MSLTSTRAAVLSSRFFRESLSHSIRRWQQAPDQTHPFAFTMENFVNINREPLFETEEGAEEYPRAVDEGFAAAASIVPDLRRLRLISANVFEVSLSLQYIQAYILQYVLAIVIPTGFSLKLGTVCIRW